MSLGMGNGYMSLESAPSGKTLKTERAHEGFLPCVHAEVLLDVIFLLEGAATCPASITPSG